MRILHGSVPAVALAIALLAAGDARAINGTALALSSSTSSSGTDRLLNSNGFVGTYITLAQAGSVTISVNAAGTTGGGPDSRMSLVIGDQKVDFDVPGGFANYQHQFQLPAGTHFVRTQYTNDFVSGEVAASSRRLAVRSLDVTGATVLNSNNAANALAAADSYVQNGRRGDATVSLLGATPGENVRLKLKQHEFNWGANFHGTSSALLSNTQYTNFFKTHFNMLVPSRAGKWNNNESTRDSNPLTSNLYAGYVDGMLDFAQANNMRARLHTLLWSTSSGAEQPGWVNAMLANPTAIDPVSGKTNLLALRDEVSERIDYYIGDGPGGLPDLADRVQEYDIYNESWHTGVEPPELDSFWDRYQAVGVSDIYKESAAAAGSRARMYTNEYNVFNWGDSYANWYRDHIEEIQNADGDPADGPVSGIGIQAYLGSGGGAFQPVRAMQSLQNLGTLGLPISLTEFGVSDAVTDPANAKQQVNEILRMMFGNPDATTFMYWSFWGGGTSGAHASSLLANADWSLTDIGKMYEDMLGIQDWDGDPTNGWTTDVILPVAADGTVDFTGFYGLYDVTVGGQTFALDLTKGTSDYALVVGPASADFNLDGTVDGADLLAWQRNLGAAGSPSAALFAMGDADYDGDVDGDDLTVWTTAMSGGSASGAANATPEPATMLLVVVACAAHRRVWHSFARLRA